MAEPTSVKLPQTLISPEDEALKRNTDCVYFLASPLTCKKGAECEYRHSEVARVNPRDCYYWLNGNCLNPKCAFRHPPLEGMLSPQAPIPSGPSLNPFQSTIPVSNAPPHNSAKQAVPCIFFQKGFCLKGDRCPFSHGAVPVSNTKAPQGPVASAPFPEPSIIRKPFEGLAKCSTERKVVENVPIQARPPLKTVPAEDETVIERSIRRSSDVEDYAPEYRQRTPPFANGDFISRPNRPQQVHSPQDYDTLNSKDTDEISREQSPGGFDVLVDDDLRETDYYHDEDQYERARGGNDGRRMTPVNDYELDRAPVSYKDLDSMVDLDRDLYGDQRRYDSYSRTREQYGRDQKRVSSERVSERRRYPRGDSPDRADGSDLRYRLSKPRKVNGLRSAVSYDLDRNGGDRSYRGSSRRDSERGVSDRLRGRIKLPGRSRSPLNERDSYRERERGRERGNSRGRLSPARVQGGRVQDRIRGRVHEDLDDVGRGLRGPRPREMYDSNVNFAGPKSLSELRGGRKSSENNKLEVPLGKRKYSDSYQQSENAVSFEGPKPLSEILKRKRGDTSNEEVANDGSKASKEGGEDSKSADEQTLERNANDFEMEEGLIVEDDEATNQENEEGYADEEGEYEYEQGEGEEDYIEEEAENVEEEGHYVEDDDDDDDGDDFAKKIGVMFS